ncbi:tRNA pseudouridine(38-40) synthase TruA [Listeria monocytogenes]|uniref:tRNA pseudouridine(38-40) synthase TruA n=1 Tax=Listeria monocytogenes TaxID=1639 RepID=UPI0008752C06|nr:tRNA pseudouridine(38-40) synthase TruA [Listeria monocytogenes]EAC4839392.1 tRNA pseudouridine(38-40) synthase TruA [Listeria monocytogenes]EAC7306907.1 tRNA pseudouridine(38-40) synthase TruA [Listeria monocytogenes]EAD2638585.1 tRNA pseudouridine(38-40) synthase TruA [Listeria monocytogenes]EAD8852736.1 tRNA pseudouridine(38-40) synthase TruA [Listeria monocytogenes]EAE6913124.1 tRNA pseudouridine(38-40) synthase TruA [Listeria monocytogenes]
MTRYKAIISYDGSGFYGYQVQPNTRTVQAEIEKALTKMHKGKTVRVTASGRTDTGVHAKGQVIHFDSELDITAEKFQKALQVMTPFDISFLTVEEVPDDFHARFGTVGKEYRYVVKRTKIFDPFSRNFALHYPYELDISKMKLASKRLIGEHDFTSFCSARTERDSKVRTLYSIDFYEEDDETLVIAFQGNGFLYNMVRILTGTLLDAGQGRISPDDLSKALLARDRQKLISKTAPPQGLYLWRVDYE